MGVSEGSRGGLFAEVVDGWSGVGGGRVLGSEDLFDGEEEVAVADGLLKKKLGTGLQGAVAIGGTVTAGDDDDWNGSHGVVGLEAFEDGESVAGGEAEVEKNDVGLLTAGLGDAGDAVDGEADIVVVRLEADVHGEAHLGVVVDDKDLLLGHGWEPLFVK